MQGPSAARRLGAGAVDRQVAVGSLVLCAIALVSAVAFTNAPLPKELVRDPAAARDLVTLMRTGEHGQWIARYDFTRTLADGRVRRQVIEEGRSGSLHVAITGTAMSLERGGRAYECNEVGERAGCTRVPDAAALPPSEVMRVAVATGAYDVIRRPDRKVAGIRAQCFRVRASGQGSLPDFGVEVGLCLSADGIVLWKAVVRPPGNVDEQIATSVQTDATRRDVRALARSFARSAAGG